MFYKINMARAISQTFSIIKKKNERENETLEENFQCINILNWHLNNAPLAVIKNTTFFEIILL